jgi:hypothetical protein
MIFFLIFFLQEPRGNNNKKHLFPTMFPMISPKKPFAANTIVLKRAGGGTRIGRIVKTVGLKTWQVKFFDSKAIETLKASQLLYPKDQPTEAPTVAIMIATALTKSPMKTLARSKGWVVTLPTMMPTTALGLISFRMRKRITTTTTLMRMAVSRPTVWK